MDVQFWEQKDLKGMLEIFERRVTKRLEELLYQRCGRVSLNQKGETRNFDVKEEIDFLNDAAFLHGDGDKEEVDIVGDGESKKIDIIDGEEIVLDQLDSIQNENMAVEDQYDIPVEVQKVISHPQLGSEEKYED
ncbi:hypothetical protein GH714_010182 [Hevea brasiliensis]|uniref:Uncharacterized protein n=1 Tax=Hevea brasiliensis TaxID=3981 RepID=A0A6A6L2M8_HEVBR|nr:hypothetical protein GH714_010153 [Hevea brasiliensis]KAF2294393.1 hypothetical protein GH714_010182 [Hevea brasiliensis]